MDNRIDPKTFNAKEAIGHRAGARGRDTAPGHETVQHTYVRQNPATGVTETGHFPQLEDQARKAEGWKRLEEITGDSVGEVDNPLPAKSGVVGPLSASERAPVKPSGQV